MRVHRATGNPDVGTNGRSVAHGRVTTGPAGWLLGERPLPGQEGDPKWYFLWLPGWPLETPLARLVTLAHGRWVVEQFYEDAKGACGLADYQGRRWDGLHRHLALVLLTYSFLATQRHFAARPTPTRPAPAGLPPRRGAAAPAGPRPPPRLPTFPAMHRRVLLWLFEDLVRWIKATDPILPFPTPYYRRC